MSIGLRLSDGETDRIEKPFQPDRAFSCARGIFLHETSSSTQSKGQEKCMVGGFKEWNHGRVCFVCIVQGLSESDSRALPGH